MPQEPSSNPAGARTAKTVTQRPMVRDWRANRSVPLRAKQLATVMMIIGSSWSAWVLPRLNWLPPLFCSVVALWLWHLPTAPVRPHEDTYKE